MCLCVSCANGQEARLQSLQVQWQLYTPSLTYLQHLLDEHCSVDAILKNDIVGRLHAALAATLLIISAHVCTQCSGVTCRSTGVAGHRRERSLTNGRKGQPQAPGVIGIHIDLCSKGMDGGVVSGGTSTCSPSLLRGYLHKLGQGQSLDEHHLRVKVEQHAALSRHAKDALSQHARVVKLLDWCCGVVMTQ